MEKVIVIRTYCRKQLWFVFHLLCVFTISIYYLDLFAAKNSTTLFSYHQPATNPLPFTKSKQLLYQSLDLVEINTKQDLDSCVGRYIYVHDIPSRFNLDILKNCWSILKWINMCEYISNLGLGPQAKNSESVLQNSSWYATNQFMLEIIFHNRMKQYKCLTNDSTLASAIFVPFYAGLDVSRYLWDNSSTLVKDSNPVELGKWLRGKTEWKEMQGQDHFFVAGRITWDFRRESDNGSDWGNRLMALPEIKNMTILGIESSPWSSNEFAIPYPTYFHPSKDYEVFEWQNKIRMKKRRFLYSFVGAPRPNSQESIRGNIISQCLASRRKCKLLDCKVKNCHNPVFVMEMFQRSKFCLQPSGDSFTRRSTFDSILAGCIPVFFHPGSAYIQYKWHLPKNYTQYSVFIPEEALRNGTANIDKILEAKTEDEVKGMREEVIRLIPRVIYAHPRASLGTLEDAFDIAVKRVVERIERIRREMKEEEL